jgi:HJR/Mrr/RecB family endonuclease
LLAKRVPAASRPSAEDGAPRRFPSSEFAEAASPNEFENNIRAWFDAHGGTTSAPAGHLDLGYDFAITVEGRVYLVEVKLTTRQSLMSLKAVRALTTVLARQNSAGGILVSNARYTSAAIDLAKESSIALVTSEDLSKARSVTELLSSAMASASYGS